ncbi:GFA family protein [Temperatibacter marinus]|uniref:GFA family protein n=1 Tax=Temperatibacter marinus TaxID=1456591 RepID=A0AA52EEK6_9PROT|nr:GFA family protein [Temperatibacter marinus]WND03361.1 GFA family protein [Temperatibacter marinus]
MSEKLYTGGCHCGAVKFEVMVEDVEKLIQCNCSMCRKTGYLHLFVSRDEFRLLKGEEALENYQFNTKTASHFFCKACGIKSFYIPRSHPDGYSIHAGCLEDFDLDSVQIEPFDGGNWEDNVDSIR